MEDKSTSVFDVCFLFNIHQVEQKKEFKSTGLELIRPKTIVDNVDTE